MRLAVDNAKVTARVRRLVVERHRQLAMSQSQQATGEFNGSSAAIELAEIALQGRDRNATRVVAQRPV